MSVRRPWIRVAALLAASLVIACAPADEAVPKVGDAVVEDPGEALEPQLELVSFSSGFEAPREAPAPLLFGGTGQANPSSRNAAAACRLVG
jgi:hypothetical protein